eukprot:6413231-Pyramimonas_sp.AAC.1
MSSRSGCPMVARPVVYWLAGSTYASLACRPRPEKEDRGRSVIGRCAPGRRPRVLLSLPFCR